MAKRKPQVGDVITTKRPIEAYYSRYRIVVPPYRNAECWFRPGMLGKVASIAPNVTGPDRDFLVVDFVSDVVYCEKSDNPYLWRVAVDFRDAVVVGG